MTILCIGEALVDLIATDPGPLADATSFTTVPGGAPTNVALAVSALGGAASLAACLGSDELGDLLIGVLTESDVDTTRVQRTHHPTTVVRVTSQRGTPEFSVERGADRFLDAEIDLTDVALVHTTAFALSLDPERSTILRTFEAAAKRGISTSFDINFSPLVWTQSISEAHAILARAVGLATYLKCSVDDMARTFGPDWDMDRIYRWGTPTAVMTAGRDHTTVFVEGEIVAEVPVPPAPVIDTTGAGDAFWGGFLTAVEAGSPLTAAVNRGHEVAALKVGKVGPLIDRVT
ncbi:MAG: hypothetical protein KJN81_09405 [Acidimicrobiia bacterium]|nr:hypothetical protein [Acidimicrobiia bacterium]NNL28631.1 hypothetical protein [Acidimicrobiia bacterium]